MDLNSAASVTIVEGLLISLTVLAGGTAAYWFVVLYRVGKIRRIVPTLRAGLHVQPTGNLWPTVMIVVPAHNEESHIANLAASLAQQDYQGEVRAIFVLDRCTDRTASVLRETLEQHAWSDRATIIENDACPEGWSGKTHAVWRGVRSISVGDQPHLLLFTDADCVFEPEAIRAAVGLMSAEKVSMLSLLPTLTDRRWWERVAQPAAGIELVRQFPLDEVNRPNNPRRFANGQFMLFRKQFYDKLGGHEAMRATLLEDLAFARRARELTGGHRRSIGVFMADGLVRCCMYETLAEFRKGWKRIYLESAYARASRLARDGYRLVCTGIVMPTLAIVCIGASIVPMRAGDRPLTLAMQMVGWAAIIIFLWTLGRVYKQQRLNPTWLAMYPIGAWIVSGILRDAARDARAKAATEWGGLVYERTGETVHTASANIEEAEEAEQAEPTDRQTRGSA